MGAGKTTVGKNLAELLELPVYDTDEEITKETGKSITSIFEEMGEQAFRKMETQMLKKLPNENAVITTGGGIILSHENRSWLKNNGKVLFLYADPEEILKRLEHDRSRPLLNKDKKEAVFSLYSDRLPLYEAAADVRINTTGKAISEIIEEILACLK